MDIRGIIWCVVLGVSVSMLSSCAGDSPTEPSDISDDGGTSTTTRVLGGEYTTPFGSGSFTRSFAALAEGEIVTITVSSTDNENRIRAYLLQGECTAFGTTNCDLSAEIAGGLGAVGSELEFFWILSPGQYTLVIDHAMFPSGTAVTYSIHLESS